MSLSAPIDIYCERLGPGLLAEPLNLFSNLSFLIAAILATRIYLRERATRGRLLIVVGLYAIAIGSALFHSFATGWAQLADVIPIGLAIGPSFQQSANCPRFSAMQTASSSEA